VIGEDWDAVLDAAIADVLDDAGPEDLHLTLRRLVHRLHDGHGHVQGPTPRLGFLPIQLARVEGVYLVLAALPGSGLRRGDELVGIDGVPIADLHASRRVLHSGSPQFVDHQLLARGAISEGENGSTATVDLRRAGRPRRVTATRTLTPPPAEFDRPAIERLAGGVLYVDIARATDAELGARMAEIARARGVVFDLRAYPSSSPDWLAHLLTRPDRARWMLVPRFIRPGGRAAAFTEHGWDMRPAQPHIAGEVAFITGPGAISYAESLMGMVEGYQLGAIVGAPTAGANGNIIPFSVPGGFRIVFTGMKVTRLDGRQHHLVGVQPTHPVERTLAGVRAGRDEELEVALALVRPRTARDRKRAESTGHPPRRAQ
jgi:C-terminal processing protease CtpA/Prc